jgi:hypothetical protein
LSPVEKQLTQIKTIRKHRVDTLRRAQTLRAMEQTRAARYIGESQAHFEQVELDLIALERESLAGLTGGGFVKVDQLVGFTKLQQKSVKTIKDTQQEINNAHARYAQAQEKYQESCAAVKVAEKKLLGLEEVLEQELWK